MSEDSAEKRPNIIRRLYLWTVSWADHPAGTWALFFIAFLESSFFPIPPDVLLMALCFGARDKWLKYASVCTAGSVLGAILGWWIGWGLWGTLQDWFIPHVFSEDNFNKVEMLYKDNAFLAVFTAAFTIIPFKVFTVAAGVFTVSLPLLIVAAIIGRGMRFFLVSGLIRIFGVKIKPFVEKHLEWCFLVGMIVLIGGFISIKYM